MEPPTLPPSACQGTGRNNAGRVPGLLLVFSAGAPMARGIALTSGSVELGRGAVSAGRIDDGRVSRRHARVALEEDRYIATDLGSQNGTFIDGDRAVPHQPTPVQRVLRIGDSLLVPHSDLRAFQRTPVRTVDGFVRGPAMQTVIEDVERAARSGSILHIRGESGAGKEGIVEAFHRASARAARALVAVNCAAIPQALAERLLFGAKRGAYSGADADAAGYLVEADGGTLFLDEVAELDLAVQAKLLRVLESKAVLPLGATRPRKVDFGLCSATNKDLRSLVASGAWREDLYFRIGRPEVALPALRNRAEEIPALIAHELARRAPQPAAHVSLIEQCLLRLWPGNVRELLSEVRSAAQAATLEGDRVTAAHLAPSAGSMFGGAPSEPVASHGAIARPPASGVHRPIPPVDDEWQQRIEQALRAHGGNVTATARSLGLHRTQLRRLIGRHGITLGPRSDGNR